MPRAYWLRLLGYSVLLSSATIYVFRFQWWWIAAGLFVLALEVFRYEAKSRAAENLAPFVLPISDDSRRIVSGCAGTLLVAAGVVGHGSVASRIVQALCVLLMPLSVAPEDPRIGDDSPANRFFYRMFSSAAYSIIAFVSLFILLMVLLPWLGIFKHFFGGG